MKTLAEFRPAFGFRHGNHAPTQDFQKVVDALFTGNIANLVGSDEVNTQPSVNIVEAAESFRIELAAPGFDKSNFDIKHEAEHNQLVVSGQKEQATEKTADRYTRREFGFSKFRRAFTLPEHVQIDGIVAKYENGILTVNMPKIAKTAPEAARSIAIEG